ncbi:MAG: phosphoribosyl-AMP cyclohydrolase [Pseudomonadota bacterium]
MREYTDQLSTQEWLENVKFNQDGLVVAIAQDWQNHAILMQAWMSRESLNETLSTKRVCYWSRSRRQLWRKGETSGHEQTLVEAYVDCDGDTLLLKVKQKGPACHTLKPTCFFKKLDI